MSSTRQKDSQSKAANLSFYSLGNPALARRAFLNAIKKQGTGEYADQFLNLCRRVCLRHETFSIQEFYALNNLLEHPIDRKLLSKYFEMWTEENVLHSLLTPIPALIYDQVQFQQNTDLSKFTEE